MRLLSLADQWAAGMEALAFGRSWSRDQLTDFQTRRLRALVRHAGSRVPYYSRLFQQAGLKAEDIRSLDDLRRIPITARPSLQTVPPRDVVAEGLDPDRLILHTTSGTSGEPLRILRTFYEEYLLRACRLREEKAAGMRLTDLRGGLGVGRRAPGLERAPGRMPFYRRLGLLRRNSISVYLPPEERLARLRAVRPDVIGGSGSSLAWICGEFTEADRAAIRPHLVLTGGETLTPEMRRQISDTLGVRVVDLYGSHEFNIIASECPQGGRYHVVEWNVIVEVMSDGRNVEPGEEGEVVVTALHSYAMPFIRYRLNDLVTLGETPCPCGAPVMTLRTILGRVIERFLLPGGERIHPYVLLSPLLTTAPWLRRYQFVQDRIDHITLKIVPMVRPTPEQERAVVGAMEEAVGGRARVELLLVDDIPKAANGKYRPYYSLVSDEGPSQGPAENSTLL